MTTTADSDFIVTYPAASFLEREDGTNDLRLAASDETTFFAGFAEHPQMVANALLVVARVARTRFYTPPNMLTALLRAADPVVTCAPEGLRFESFSPCCGVYARLDIDDEALDVRLRTNGTTNVDVNPELRQLLAGIGPGEPLRLQVGRQALTVTTLDGTVVEKQVPLPPRWLNGFAETQVAASRMEGRFDLTPQQTREFFRTLPRASATRTVQWATRTPRGARLASSPSPGAVCAAGAERLRTLEPLVKFARRLRAYGTEAHSGSPAAAGFWELSLPGSRLTIGLSPGKSRGFSGEGHVLPELIGDHVEDDSALLGAALALHQRVDIAELTTDTGLPRERVTAALTRIAADGLLGYDLRDARYFLRALPYPAQAFGVRQPRLRDAQRLVSDGCVRPGSADGSFFVHSGGVEYPVTLEASIAQDRCLCPWYGKYRGARGPCKHVLAARMSAQREVGC